MSFLSKVIGSLFFGFCLAALLCGGWHRIEAMGPETIRRLGGFALGLLLLHLSMQGKSVRFAPVGIFLSLLGLVWMPSIVEWFLFAGSSLPPREHIYPRGEYALAGLLIGLCFCIQGEEASSR